MWTNLFLNTICHIHVISLEYVVHLTFVCLVEIERKDGKWNGYNQNLFSQYNIYLYLSVWIPYVYLMIIQTPQLRYGCCADHLILFQSWKRNLLNCISVRYTITHKKGNIIFHLIYYYVYEKVLVLIFWIFKIWNAHMLWNEFQKAKISRSALIVYT